MSKLNKRGVQDSQANLASVRHLLLSLKAEAEQQMTEAEARVIAFNKLLSFSNMAAEQLGETLAAIEAAEHAKPRPGA